VSLKSITAEAEAIVLALTPQQRADVVRAIGHFVEGVKSLDAIPERLFKLIGIGGVEVVLKVSAGWRLESLADQIIKASPRLLTPNRAVIDDMLGALQREKTAAGRAANDNGKVR
jgi:hypothetical protein